MFMRVCAMYSQPQKCMDLVFYFLLKTVAIGTKLIYGRNSRIQLVRYEVLYGVCELFLLTVYDHIYIYTIEYFTV